jgi:hypothetical protein
MDLARDVDFAPAGQRSALIRLSLRPSVFTRLRMSGLWSGSGPSHSMQRTDRGPLPPGGSARLIGLLHFEQRLVGVPCMQLFTIGPVPWQGTWE